MEIEEMLEFVNSTNNELNGILDDLNFDYSYLFNDIGQDKDINDLITCPYNEQHKIPRKSIKKHFKKCYLKSINIDVRELEKVKMPLSSKNGSKMVIVGDDDEDNDGDVLLVKEEVEKEIYDKYLYQLNLRENYSPISDNKNSENEINKQDNDHFTNKNEIRLNRNNNINNNNVNINNNKYGIKRKKRKFKKSKKRLRPIESRRKLIKKMFEERD
eukprot:TRINITY_DN5661_c0_g1_i1.p1 TRINITY_DN5661_c0_g1~~TRINITY_DN5661_c0_g1_i1.p1  ORF type:complete len:215 (+),score=47.59 TRINITY_DN5661_c0_g1_i1:96-740(+)